ncbi:hypothetical protein V6B14_03505 [Sporosarcina psychrophila]|uniref:hypothetical protein n=1 Tax=Sporosarcina psychrophila TaxID=1476 RepID=UPI0030CE80FA
MCNLFAKINKKFQGINENSQAIISNSFATFFIKGGALLVSLLTFPEYLKYFNDQSILGFWFTLLAVLSWVLAFDLGIGNGLRNRLVPTFVSKDYILSKKYISSAYIILSVITSLIILISIILFKFIDWNLIFNISEKLISRDTLTTAITIVFIGIMLQFIFKLINSILYALQKSALNNLLSLITSISIFLYVFTSSSNDLSTNLISLAIVHVLAVNLPLILASLIIFNKSLKKSRPNYKFYSSKYAKEIVFLGGIFFWVQIMYMILSVTNEFLITRLTGPADVVEYQIYYKIFTVVGTIFTVALTPMWSAVTKALFEKDYIWIKKLYKNLTWVALIVMIVQFLLVLILQPLINFWLQENAIPVNYIYGIIFAISGSLFIWIGVLSTITNGLGLLKIQSIFYTIGVLVKIPLAWLLVGVLNSWIGVVVANIIALSLFCIIQPIWISRFINKKVLGDEENV